MLDERRILVETDFLVERHMATVYGVNGGPRRPLFYVVLVSVLGGVALLAGIVTIATGGAVALATLTGAMVACGRWPPSDT
jgi:hypothetical protein